MIVQPDFLDHWKTQMLMDLLGDTHAPLFLIRLWGHCQARKTHRFPVGSPSVLKAICRASCDAEKFESAMITSGFLEKIDGFWVVHDWDSANYTLIRSWENGKKGGRPKNETHGEPTLNPRVTHGIPMGTPSGTHVEPIREEKRREEKIRELPPTPSGGDGVKVLKSKSKKCKAADLDAAAFPNFLTWWNAYPNKKNKQQALKSWHGAGLESIDQEPLLRILDFQKRQSEWTKDNGQYVPHPSTYLNQARYMDDPAEIQNPSEAANSSPYAKYGKYASALLDCTT